MDRSGNKRRKAKLTTPARPVFTRTDWLCLAGISLAMTLAFVGYVAFELHLRHEADLSRTLTRWRAGYHLTVEQERQIRAEEARFHGTATPLTRPRRNAEEAAAQEVALSRLMNPEDGARFLAAHRQSPGAVTNQVQAVNSAMLADPHP